MINLKNIQYKISQKIILQNIDLNIQEGKTTVIMGKNGSGKSTLLKLLNQVIKPTSGLFDSTLSKPVPMLFQKPLMLQNSVNYNYHILQKIKKHRINHFWFKKFDLSHLSNQKINSLSEGEKQKVFISRIMSFDQSHLFLDEPNQSLDLQSEKLLIDLLINEKNQKTIVMTLHDFEIAKRIGDYFIYLENGKILLQDSYEDFFKKFNF
jgi:ABC-type cobalamin/Fe3+-siderophores transport system ATPase subunit